MLAVLDGDIVAFQAAAASLKTIDWDDGRGPQTITDIPSAMSTACSTIEDWTTRAGCNQTVVCFSSRAGHNFRKHLTPTYKSNRAGVEKPAGYWEIVDGIESRFKCWRVEEGLEADDVMGIAGTSDRFGDTVIVSLDKDMLTIPGRVFRPHKDVEPRTISVNQADLFWMTQTLTGDAVDGYKGCPKIGPVNAERILAPHVRSLSGMWRAVVDTFLAAGLTEADALLQARLARILRSSDYNRDNKEISLWHPTKPEKFPLMCATSPRSSQPQASPALSSAKVGENTPSTSRLAKSTAKRRPRKAA